MVSFLFIFLMSFLRFSKNVFFLGFSLLFLSCFLVFYVWKFVSQWMGLIFFLVYITGVIVIFIFFCSFSRNIGGLIYKPIFSLLFFIFLVGDNISFFYVKDRKNLSQSAEFYFISEISQIFLLGVWLIFVLWSSLKIINILGGSIRLI
jgi:hypothetical protein